MFEWGSLLAAIPVAALVSLATTLVIRKRDRPQAYFVVENMHLPSKRSLVSDGRHLSMLIAKETPARSYTVMNSGDSAAYWLHFETNVKRCLFVTLDPEDPRGGRMHHQIAKLEPGEEATVFIWLHEDQNPPSANVHLTWMRTPVRHYRFEQQRIDLNDPFRVQLPYSLWSRYRPNIRTDADLG